MIIEARRRLGVTAVMIETLTTATDLKEEIASVAIVSEVEADVAPGLFRQEVELGRP